MLGDEWRILEHYQPWATNDIYIFKILEQAIRYNLVWGSLRLINREAIYENLLKNFKYSL